MFLPECRPVLIGSLPLRDHREALRLIFQHTPEIPLWPQLPKLPKEGMIRQFLTSFPGLVEDGERFWIDAEAADFPGQMAVFYEDYLLFEQKKTPPASHAVLAADTAAGFFAFLQKLGEERRQPLTVKGQITGPVTTGIGVHDQQGRAIVYDDNLRDMLVKMISMKAAWQVRQLQPFAGKGVPRDVVEALHWLLRAEAGGAGELAAGFLREAQAHAKPAQRTEAERRAAEKLR